MSQLFSGQDRILSEIASLSGAEHYYSARGSHSEGVDSRRAPLVHVSEGERLGEYVSLSVSTLLSRFGGWLEESTVDASGTVRLQLRERWSRHEPAFAGEFCRLAALDVWRRVSAGHSGDASRRAAEEYSSRLSSLLCSLAV